MKRKQWTSSWATLEINESVKIDICHAELIKGLVMATKPSNILEIGVGGARSMDAVLDAIEYNQNNPQYTVVDNWCDFAGKIPEEFLEIYGPYITNLITSGEKEFVFSNHQDKYDFIISDADHHRTNEWFEYVYENLLEDSGILIYHDINLFPDRSDCFQNLAQIYEACVNLKLKYKIFNKSTLPTEKCHRGLLVIFK